MKANFNQKFVLTLAGVCFFVMLIGHAAFDLPAIVLYVFFGFWFYGVRTKDASRIRPVPSSYVKKSRDMTELSASEIRWLRTARAARRLSDMYTALEAIGRFAEPKRSHPLVLRVMSDLLIRSERWRLLVDTSTKLIQVRPHDDRGWINRAFALHKLKRTREALCTLLPVADKFGNSWGVFYNLACYSCQLGNKKEAVEWLRRTFKVAVDRDIRSWALGDPDLEPIREEIKGICG